MIVALSGGVGAARFLRGLAAVVDPSSITAIVNTGDDVVLHGLRVSPDLDTVTYTLGGAINPETGWGLAGETWSTMDALARFGGVAPAGSAAGLTWFRLGDRDMATHLYRTQRLAEGASLGVITAEVANAWGVGIVLLPMSEDRVETRVDVLGEGEIGFQEYFVGRHHAVAARGVRFVGADVAQPAPGVLDALAAATHIVICPSNPILSIWPILAVPGIRDLVAARRRDVVAISPIVAGSALKGPADRLLVELGYAASVVGVARLYADLAACLVIDDADADLAGAVEAEGLRCVVAPTVMQGPAESAALAQVVLSAAAGTTP